MRSFPTYIRTEAAPSFSQPHECPSAVCLKKLLNMNNKDIQKPTVT